MRDRTTISILCIILFYTWFSQHTCIEYADMVKGWFSLEERTIQEITTENHADYIFKNGEYHWFNGETYVPLDPEPYKEDDVIEHFDFPDEKISLHVPDPSATLTVLNSDKHLWTSSDITIDSSHALVVGNEIDGPYVEINYDSIVYRTADGQEGQIYFEEFGKGSNNGVNAD